jgi:hypothetical protein
MTLPLGSSSIIAVLLLIGLNTSTFASVPTPAAAHLGNIGPIFEPNVGQIDAEIDYIARAGATSLSLTASEFSLSTVSSNHGADTLRVHFLGARADAKPLVPQALTGTVSDYAGSDPINWHIKIPTFGRIQYSDIYPGIDVAYHSADGGFEYDFLIGPGANPAEVRLAFEGADSLRVDSDGSLVATLRGNAIIQRKPVAYQDILGSRRPVQVAYHIESGNIVHFELGAYDASQALIIDPLAYSILSLGPNAGGAMGHHIAIDAAGNAYVAGELMTGASPPNTDAVVAKFAPDGTLIWRQVFHGHGGLDGMDVASGIALDSSATHVFVAGTTTSDDFTVTASAFSATCGGAAGQCNGKSDAFVMQLNAVDGTPVYSSYFGGGYDDTANAVAVDGAGFVYITGAGSQFPTKGGSSHTAHSGNSPCQFDAYLAKFDMTKTGAASLVFSVAFGGDGDDQGNALAIAPGQVRLIDPCTHFPCHISSTGTIYVVGTTGGTCIAGGNYPFPTTPNAFSSDAGLLPQGFITLFDTSGARLLYSSTLLGAKALGVAIGPRVSAGRRVGLFAQGYSNAVITGATDNVGTFSTAFQPSFGGGQWDAYVQEIDPTGSGNSSLVFFTYLGGAANDEGHDIATDASGNVTVVGSTNSTNFPIPHTVLPRLRPVQATLSPPTCGGDVVCTDAFVATLSSNGRFEGYATYLGGKLIDSANGVAICNTGPCANSIYLTGTTFSPDFPGTGGSFTPGPDQFVAKISLPSPPPVIVRPRVTP